MLFKLYFLKFFFYTKFSIKLPLQKSWGFTRKYEECLNFNCAIYWENIRENMDQKNSEYGDTYHTVLMVNRVIT